MIRTRCNGYDLNLKNWPTAIFILLVFLACHLHAQKVCPSPLQGAFYSASKGANFLKSNKKFTYKCYYIDEKLDTLSEELLTIQNTEKPNPLSASQSMAIYTFDYSQTDTTLFYPTEHNQRLKWLKQIEAGVVNNGESFYIHPIQSNQYYLTEVAPPPFYCFGCVVKMSTFKIRPAWGKFKGLMKVEYSPSTKTSLEIEGKKYDDCEKIFSKSNHSKKGKSTLTFYVDKSFGFVKMDYYFFNKHQIIFNLIKVEDI
jgi:hypothetical protein